MNFIIPSPEELSYLRPEPLLWEQELDVRPEVAEAIEKEASARSLITVDLSEFEAVPGKGVKARIQGKKIMLGNRKLMA